MPRTTMNSLNFVFRASVSCAQHKALKRLCKAQRTTHNAHKVRCQVDSGESGIKALRLPGHQSVRGSLFISRYRLFNQVLAA